MNRWVTNIYMWTSLKYFVGSVCTYKTVWLLVDWYFVFPLKKKKDRWQNWGSKRWMYFSQGYSERNPEVESRLILHLVHFPSLTLLFSLSTSTLMQTDLIKSLSRPPHRFWLDMGTEELALYWKSDSQRPKVSCLGNWLIMLTSDLLVDEGRKTWPWSARRHSSLIPPKKKRTIVAKIHAKFDWNRSK